MKVKLETACFWEGNQRSVYDARPHSCRTFPDLVRGEWSLVARMWQMPEKATFGPIASNTLEAFKDEVDFKK